MKQLSSEITDILALTKGVEPKIIVAIEWVDDQGYVQYSNREIPGVLGFLKSIGNISYETQGTTINTSTVSIVIQDHDGKLKEFYDTRDLHKRKCVIKQYLEDVTPKEFVIFQGLTNSPIVWDEGTRELSLSIVSEVESKEVGFSPEEAEYEYVSPDAVGQAWPLCFGNVVHVPAVRTRQRPVGELKTKLSIVDPVLYYKSGATVNAYFQQIFLYNYYMSLAQRAEAIAPSIPELVAEYTYLIGQEDAMLRALFDLETELQGHKKALEAQKVGLVVNVFGNVAIPLMAIAQRRVRMKELRAYIRTTKKAKKTVTDQKKLLEKKIDNLEYEIEVQRDAFRAQNECFNNIQELYFTYKDILQEICDQKKTVVDTIVVKDGKDFPQNQDIDLLINDLRVRGSFAEDVFTVKAIIPKYVDVPLGTRPTVTDPCGHRDSEEANRLFWVSSSEYVLNGCYVLCEDTSGRKHIIKIIEQEGARCKYELIPFATDSSGGGSHRNGNSLFESQVPIPNFGDPLYPLFPGPFDKFSNAFSWVSNFVGVQQQQFNALGDKYAPPAYFGQTFNFANYNIYTAEFINQVNTLLTKYNTLPLDRDEYLNFQRMQNLLMADRAEPYIFLDAIHDEDIYTLIGPKIKRIVEVAAVPQQSWLRNKDIYIEEMPDAADWSATPGDSVYVYNDSYEVYVANILPSEVVAVSAYRRNENGETYLDIVPPEYYTLNESEDLGDITVTSLKFPMPLSVIPGEEWDDQIYVTLNSSVGPNVVDILEYLITEYTDKTYDETSFDAVRDLFEDKYPASFALFDRLDILTLLQQIAYQARCSLLLINDVFYLKYLSKEPASVRTLSRTDVETGTLQLTYNETEDLTTKYIAKWREDYLPETEIKEYVIRHNINKYGLHESTVDYFIYNIESLVIKSATFWALRQANTWKRVSFTTTLKHIDLELLDCINFSFSGIVSSTKAMIENISYDPNTFAITVQCWLPIKAGKTTQYPFAWPADQVLTFPLVDDDAGGRRFKLKYVGVS